MNKKVLFLSAGIMMSAAAFAQKDKLKTATKELETATELTQKSQTSLAATSFGKAKEAIDLAVTNPETKEKPETWQTKAGIYLGMQGNEMLRADNPYKEGVAALNKAIQLNPKLSSDLAVVNMLANGAFYAYNDGIQTYNGGKYQDAYTSFKTAKDLLGEDKDKRFILMPIVDTIRAQSVMFMGYNAFYASSADEANANALLDDAIANLNKSKTSPYLNDASSIYLVLANAYQKKGDKAGQKATITEALAKYPDDKNLKALELNYAIESGSKDEAISKMEAAVAKDPKNADLHMNLGILYYAIAYPVDGTVNPKAAEYLGKTEEAYKQAVTLDPGNATYNFQLGSLYFNNASRIIGEMNKLGTSKADDAKYEQFNKDKEAEFAKALPYLEKARDIFMPRKMKLTAEEGKEFINCLTGLKEIYIRTNQAEKAAETKKVLNEITGN